MTNIFIIKLKIKIVQSLKIKLQYACSSKVMWGTYETEELKEGVISIDYHGISFRF